MLTSSTTCREFVRISIRALGRNGFPKGFQSSSRELTDPSREDLKPDSSRPPPSSSKTNKQTYPLYPSIVQLLHEKGIPHSEVDKIPASGPKGRLLKGDVLAYLGAISSSYSSDQSARISRLAHLDLGNIQIAPPPKMEHPPSKSSEKPYEILEPDTEVAVSISLTAVLELQKRIQSTLGTTLPLSTFISRAIEVANVNLPRSKSLQPSADELFNQILGLDSISPKSSRGGFIPQIIALPSTLTKSQSTPGPSKTPDIIELLTAQPLQNGKASRLDKTPPVAMVRSESGVVTNVFTVSVKKGDEMRARVFLERVKTALQVEPGSLVL